MSKQWSLVSRGNTNNELLKFKNQELMFTEIENKKDVHHFRMLREAILASKRCDSFAIKVYENSVIVALEASDFGEMFKSLSQLLTNFYKFEKSSNTTKMCNLYLLYVVCVIPNVNLMEINNALNLCMNYFEISPKTIAIQWYLASKLNNYVHLNNILLEANEHESILLRISIDKQQNKILQALLKSFYTIKQQSLEKYLMIKENQNLNIVYKELTGKDVEINNEIVQLKSRKSKTKPL